MSKTKGASMKKLKKSNWDSRTCKHCGKRFLSLAEIEAHINTVHNINQVATESRDPEYNEVENLKNSLKSLQDDLNKENFKNRLFRNLILDAMGRN